MTITESRKAELAEKFGVGGCITTNSWIDAAIQDLTGMWRIYSDDARFLYNNINWCKPADGSSPGSPGGGSGGEQDETPPIPSGSPKLVLLDSRVPTPIKPGKVNWFGIHVRNDGTAAWKGYLGVKLLLNNEVVFRYDGSKQYVQTVNVGDTKWIWCSTEIPPNIPSGEYQIVIIKTTL